MAITAKSESTCSWDKIKDEEFLYKGAAVKIQVAKLTTELAD